MSISFVKCEKASSSRSVQCWIVNILLHLLHLTLQRSFRPSMFECSATIIFFPIYVIEITNAAIFRYSHCLIESKILRAVLGRFFVLSVHYLVQSQWDGQTGRPLAASSSGWGQSSHQNTPWPWRRYPSTPAEPRELAGGLEWSSRSAARGKSHLSPDKTHYHMINTSQIGQETREHTTETRLTSAF